MSGMSPEPQDQPPRVQPGAGTGIIGPELTVLVDGPTNHPVVTALAGVVLSGAGIVEVIDRLTEHDISTLPGFACVAQEPDGIRVLIRGRLTVTAFDGSGRSETHDAVGRSTWNELTIASPTELRIEGAGQSEGEPFELRTGLVSAGAIDLTAIQTRNEPVAPSGEGPTPANPRWIGPTENPEGDTEGVANSLDLVLPSTTEALLVPPTVSEDAIDASAAPQPDKSAPAAADHLPTIEPAPDDDLDFHHLFEETTYRSPVGGPDQGVDDPRVDDPSVDDQGDVEDPTDPPTRIFTDADVAPPPPAEPEAHHPVAAVIAPVIPPHEAGTGLIDFVPGMGTAPSPLFASPPPPTTTSPAAPPAPEVRPPPAPTPEVVAPDELDDATISAAALRVLRERTQSTSANANPTAGLAAIKCPAGHPNPIHNDVCRACESPITDRTTVTIPRPTLGRLRFENGLVAVLDRHLVIGRNPGAEIRVNGEETGMVKIDDPDSLLSRSHATVQLDGWQLLLTDRDSMNHTFVEVPGRPPFQLRPGEPYPLPIGTIVRLGDEVTFTYEASERA